MNRLPLIILLFQSLLIFSQVNLTSDLKLCMPFNGNANDVSGSGNNGTVSGVVLTTDRFSNASSAYQFNNGSSDYISVSNFANLAPTNELTISMWAKSDLTTANCLFALQPDNQSDRCVGCAQYTDGGGATMLIWDYGNILTGGRSTVSSVPADISNWHHYVYIISQSGNSKKIYLDGVLKSNTSYSLSVSNKNFPLYIGAGLSNGTGNSIRFRGKIDDICIYNRALNPNEVAALYSGTGVCFSVGIQELTDISNGIFYPTISENGIYTYSGDLSKLKSIEIYSVDGKLLNTISELEIIESNGKLNMNNLTNGLYFVKLLKGDSNYIQKVIIE